MMNMITCTAMYLALLIIWIWRDTLPSHLDPPRGFYLPHPLSASNSILKSLIMKKWKCDGDSILLHGNRTKMQ